MGVLNVSIAQLLPGMIVAEDVISPTREVILAKNTILSPKSIIKLKMRPIKEIIVFIPDSLAEKMSANAETYTNKIKESIEFKKFKKTYASSLGSVKNSFQKFCFGNTINEVNSDELLLCLDNIMLESRNSIHTFEMLHCMRDYDDITYVHSINVALICHSFGQWLNLSNEDIRLLTLAGLLHDIGKMSIPSEIVTKPASLTPAEYAIVKNHAMLGYNLVKNINSLDPRIKQAVLMHHERCDGSGYPSGLKDKDIIPFAKIVSISDVYDAMTANRVYRNAICPFDVVENFEHEGYTKYDTGYLLTFLENIVQSYIHAPVRLSNSLIGEVIMINRANLSKPIVQVEDQFYDLAKTPDIKIKYIL